MHGMIGRESSQPRRIVRRHSDWTLKEHEVLVSHWPDMNAIRKRMPHRSVRAIRAFAGRCNLTSERHIWTAAEDARLRKLAAAGSSRKDIATELGMTVRQIAGRMRYTRIAVARKPPTPSKNPLVNAIRQRAYDLNMSMIDLDRSLGDRKIFQHAAGKQKVARAHIERAVRALGGKFVIEWCDE